MRRVTRNLVVAVALVVVALLALGALPSYLGTGDPYYLTTEPIETDEPTIDVTNVSERRYPYLVGALTSDDGRSDGYQTGPYGVKEPFTHSPFDEIGSLAQQRPAATTAETGRVRYEGETYRVEVVQA